MRFFLLLSESAGLSFFSFPLAVSLYGLPALRFFQPQMPPMQKAAPKQRNRRHEDLLLLSLRLPAVLAQTAPDRAVPIFQRRNPA